MTNIGQSELVSVYLERRPALLRFFATRLSSLEAAEDLVQEIYLKLSERPDLGAGVANPGAFLFRMGANLMLDRLKGERRSRARDGAWRGLADTGAMGEPLDETPDAETTLEARRRLAAVVTAVEELPPGPRRAFELHKLKGLSHAETAQAMGLSKSAIEKHVSAALKHLLARGL